MYADESSSTGENLLDASQPVFCVAGVHMSTERAQRIIDDVCSHLPATHGEPKYTSLAKTDNGRAALLTAFASFDGAVVRAYLAHKRFMVVAKLVDMLVEEYFHENGYDMYGDGSAVGLANLIYLVGPVMGDAAAFEDLLETFVGTVRTRTRASVNDLFTAIATYKSTASPEWANTIDLLELTRGQANEAVELVASGELRDSLDPAIPCLYSLCEDMGTRLGRFSLVHDNSNVLARGATQLLKLHELPDPLRPGSSMDSLPVSAISFSDSATVPQLQIADWVAGAARQWATGISTGNMDRFAQGLGEIVAPWLVDAIWPNPEAIGTPRPPRRGG